MKKKGERAGEGGVNWSAEALRLSFIMSGFFYRSLIPLDVDYCFNKSIFVLV